MIAVLQLSALLVVKLADEVRLVGGAKTPLVD